MTKNSSPKYSLIVVGGGITGLSTAIAFAKNHNTQNYPVLVLEQHKIVGGMVTSFRRQGFTFDTAQLIPDPQELFDYFGVQIPLKKFHNYFARIFLVRGDQTETFYIPSGFDQFKSMLLDRFPGDAKAIRRFFDCSRAMFKELDYLKLEPQWLDFVKILAHCPNIVRNAQKTFQEYFNGFGFKDPKIEEIFDVFAAFSGLPAGRAVALMTVAAMNTSLNGAFRPEKGFIQLPHALKKRAQDLGCTVSTNSRVEKILIEDNQAKGVRLKNGLVLYADHVVVTADTKLAMQELVGLDVLEKADKKYAKKVQEVKMSASSVTISLGLDEKIDLKTLGMDCGYNVITTGKGTFEEMFRAFDRGEFLLDPACFHCAAICPSLTTGGKPVVIIRVVPVPMANWATLRQTDRGRYRAQKEKVADFYIRIVERYLLPDLRKHIVYRDVATPATFERYMGTPTGSNYDMAPYPQNFGLGRLKTRTPVRGLYLPKFSHGIWPSMQAGLQVVDMITGGKVLGGYSRYRKN